MSLRQASPTAKNFINLNCAKHKRSFNGEIIEIKLAHRHLVWVRYEYFSQNVSLREPKK